VVLRLAAVAYPECSIPAGLELNIFRVKFRRRVANGNCYIGGDLWQLVSSGATQAVCEK